MAISKNKAATVVSLFLMLAMAISLVALPAANAHTPPWTIATYLKIHVNPNPVGVGQETYIVMFTTWALPDPIFQAWAVFCRCLVDRALWLLKFCSRWLMRIGRCSGTLWLG